VAFVQAIGRARDPFRRWDRDAEEWL